MTIKSKLIIVILLVVAIVSTFAGLIVYDYFTLKNKTQVVNDDFQELYLLMTIRKDMLIQMNELMDYIVTTNNKHLKKFNDYSEGIEASLDDLISGDYRVSEDTHIYRDTETIEYIRSAYQDVQNSASEVVELMRKDRFKKAYDIVEDEIEPWLNETFFKSIDDEINRNVLELQESHNKILVTLGIFPWIEDESLEIVHRIKVSLDYITTVDSIRANILRQMKEVLDYFVALEKQDINQYREFGVEVSNSFNKWFKLIKNNQELFGITEETNLEHAFEIRDKYRAGFSKVEKNFSRGRRAQYSTYNAINDNLEPFINRAFEEEIDNTSSNIAALQSSLFDIATEAGIKILAVLALVSLVIILITLRLINSIIYSLDRLKEGSNIVGKGDLDYRINLRGRDELSELAGSFDSMTEQLQKSRENIIASRNYMERIFRSINDSIIVISIGGVIKSINNVTCELLGYEEDELVGKKISRILNQGSDYGYEDLNPGYDSGSERVYIAKDGREIAMLCSSSFIKEGDQVQGILLIGTDLTERNKIREIEKQETLLKEIHHRVKNNLQVVSTLLELQSKKLTDDTSLEIFKESQNRIRSIAFIHEMLYQSSQPGMINFSKYVNDLTANLVRFYDNGGVNVRVNFNELFVKMDTAVPCGLIVNELVSNSLKHGFKSKQTGSINIDFNVLDGGSNGHNGQSNPERRRFELSIMDNGEGLPEDFEAFQSDSFGLKLVDILVKQQLKGDITYSSIEGTRVDIVFSEK